MSARSGRVRLIGGRWRGRRLPVAPVPGLRPTPDRLRETLFNWLAPDLPGARCLDLFAGSGALAFEAVSRGAAEAVLVERSARVARRLAEEIARFDPAALRLWTGAALDYLTQPPARPFDIVFLDPPFGSPLLAAALRRLTATPGWLHPASLLYVEFPDAEPPALPPGWHWQRRARAGAVGYALLGCTAPREETPP